MHDPCLGLSVSATAKPVDRVSQAILVHGTGQRQHYGQGKCRCDNHWKIERDSNPQNQPSDTADQQTNNGKSPLCGNKVRREVIVKPVP